MTHVPDELHKPHLSIGQMGQDVLALANPAVPKIYANGFTLGLTNADVQIVFKLFGRPILVLSLSYTLAKTMAEQFSDLVEHWEKQTGQKLQTTQTIDKAFSPPGPKVENKPQ
jgi:hypothetical protein